MMVNLNLPAESAQSLTDKAANQGQRLEGLLQGLAEHAADISSTGGPAGFQPYVDDDRPWRGVFVLDYPRREIFKAAWEVNVNTLPSLPPEVVIDNGRLTDNSN